MLPIAAVPIAIASIAASSTIPIERRRGERAATVFTIGKISFDGRSLPCMVRDLSEGGMRIQLPAPPPPGARVLIEMRGLDPRLARVRWAVGHEAGLSFDLRCCPADIFAARTSRSGRIARQPRFPLRRAVPLLIDNRPIPAMIENISVGGARLTLSEPLEDGRQGVLGLTLGDRDGVAGTICWARDDSCGFRFVQPISSVTLAVTLDSVGLS
ncbi:PilZ domain-containing protein [Sphingobium sp. Z007]|nr:PilZ domain-containing protein [Sphingobium sp. Z007]